MALELKVCLMQGSMVRVICPLSVITNASAWFPFPSHKSPCKMCVVTNSSGLHFVNRKLCAVILRPKRVLGDCQRVVSVSEWLWSFQQECTVCDF